MPGLPASVTDDAQRSWWAADAFEAADAAGAYDSAVTFDEQSGGASIQLGWRARVQVSDEAVDVAIIHCDSANATSKRQKQ